MSDAVERLVWSITKDIAKMLKVSTTHETIKIKGTVHKTFEETVLKTLFKRGTVKITMDEFDCKNNKEIADTNGIDSNSRGSTIPEEELNFINNIEIAKLARRKTKETVEIGKVSSVEGIMEIFKKIYNTAAEELIEKMRKDIIIQLVHGEDKKNNC